MFFILSSIVFGILMIVGMVLRNGEIIAFPLMIWGFILLPGYFYWEEYKDNKHKKAIKKHENRKNIY